MNKYKKIYDSIIQYYKENIPDKKLEYCEYHHIIPKSIGGKKNKENMVLLPYRVHVFVHECLYKYYKDTNQKLNEIKMLIALKALLGNSERGKRPSVFNSRRMWFNKMETLERLKHDPRIRRYEYNGKNLTLHEWAKETNINEHTLYCRIHTYGWSIQEALTINDINTGKCKCVKAKNQHTDALIPKYTKLFNFLILNFTGNNHKNNYNLMQSVLDIGGSYSNIKKVAIKYCKDLVEEYEQIRTEYKIRHQKIKKSRKVIKIPCQHLHEMPIEKVREIFHEYITHGIEYVNKKFTMKYKNKLSIESAFNKIIPYDICKFRRSKKVILSDESGDYTMSELKNILKRDNRLIHRLIKRFKNLGKIIRFLDENNENEKKFKEKLIDMFNSYKKGGYKQVIIDFPNCKYSPSGLRGYFSRYIPELYNPKKHNYTNLKGMDVTINGITKKIGEWARESGVSVNVIRNRIKSGVPDDKILCKKKANGKYYMVHGKEITMFEASIKYNIPRTSIYRLMKSGLTLEQSVDKMLNLKSIKENIQNT